MTKNDHILPKNALNDLKIWHMMYFGDFYQFPKFGKFSSKIARFSGKKHVFFRRLGKNLKNNVRRKFYAFLGKWSNWPKNWYTCTLGPLLQQLALFLGYLVFLPFYGSRYVPRGLFLVKIGQNWPKIAVSAHIGTRKRAKTPNIKKLIDNYCSRGPKVHLYQFLG